MKRHKVNFYINFFSLKKLFVVSLALFIFSEFAFAGDTETSVTTITIINARQTNYKKDEASGSDTIILEGDVNLRVQKDSTTSEISANKITYDRKTEMLYAEGNVSIVTKDSNSGNDTATADTLLLNTSTLEAVFDGGRIVQTQSDALSLPSGSTLIVFSQVFGRSESNVIAFKNSSLTFCDDEDPHWKINATRTWLLPGGEFAFFNALLFVGEIPVLYLPAFYYPKDELIFNPVFGVTKRKGSYVQNTYYIKGRKSSSSSTSASSSSSDDTTAATLKSLYNFMKPSGLKEQVREGLMYHNLDKDYTGNTSEYLKVMGDWYENLGYMAGIEGVFTPSKTYMTSLNTSLRLGFSNTIYSNSSGYSYVDSSGNKTWDNSQFMGLEMPFRYSGNLSFTISKPVRITLSMPVYSDPYFQNDFHNRSESMDWISYFMSLADKEDDTSVSPTSSFLWQLTSSYSPTLPAVIKPYVSSLSFNINSSLTFQTKTTDGSELDKIEDKKKYSSEWSTYTPLRSFYYPSQITPVTVTSSLSGTLFQYNSDSKTSKKSSSSTKPSYTVALNKPEELKNASEIQSEIEKQKKLEEENTTVSEDSAKKETETTEEAEPVFEYNPKLPDIATSAISAKSIGGNTYNLGYSISPNLTTQIAYDNGILKKPADFEWEKVKSFMYTIKAPVNLNSKLSLRGDFFSLTNGLSYSPIWQDHPYVRENKKNDDGSIITDGGYEKTEYQSLLKADATASSQTLTSTNSLSFKPFTYSEKFSDSKIGYTMNMKILRYELDTTKANKIDTTKDGWEDELKNAFVFYTLDNIDWDRDEGDTKDKKYYPESFFTTNALDVTLAAAQKNKTIKESLTLTSVLWPLNYSPDKSPLSSKYSGSFSVSIPHTTFSVSTAFVQLDPSSYGGRYDLWEWDPISQSISFSYTLLGSSLSLSESLSWDPYAGVTYDSADNYKKNDPLETKNKFQNLRLSGSWKNLSLSYVCSYTNGADLVKEGGLHWESRSDKEFLPYSMSFGYSPKNLSLFNTRLSLGLSTSLNIDLIKPTNTSFSFVPSINLKTKVINVSFSATSKNSVLYWYFHDDILNYQLGNNWAENMLIDLGRSFNFWNENDRKASGYKLKSLNLTMSHDLHDWKFNMSMSVSPRLVTVGGKKTYSMDPYMTLAVVWNPMDSIKTQIEDKYGVWKLN